MRIVIEATRPDDINAVRELLETCNLPVAGVSDQFSRFYIAKYGEDVVGAIGLEVYDCYGFLRSCCVVEKYRNEHIGSMLTGKVIGKSKEMGLQSLYLMTEDKVGFFAKHGFAQIDRARLPKPLLKSALFSNDLCCTKAVSMVIHLGRTHSEVGKDALVAAIQNKYAVKAKSVSSSGSCCGVGAKTFVTKDLYDNLDKNLPEEAFLASLGCGNPTYLAQISEGETVLDLGCGGGLDVLISARRVGLQGRVYGLDMTEEMLSLARTNLAAAGFNNVEFMKGRIEDIPLPAQTVDLIISNCVINLSTDKDKAFSEAFRVLKPGGRLAISDIMFLKGVPVKLKGNIESWAGCIAGALQKDEYLVKLEAAGFTDVTVEVTRKYRLADYEKYPGFSELTDTEKAKLDGVMTAAFIRAIK